MNNTTGTHYLPIGSRLGEFEIVGQLGEGGFSIVYLAWDHSLERQIALKEYMPSGFASRSRTSLVSVRSEHHRPTFDLGLKSFINEAKLLAQFDHPALLKVYRFWEANGTAYMAMPFYKGLTFKETVKAMSGSPSERWLLDVLDPLTASLNVIHAKNCYHRDIAPDNIIILEESLKPLLLDFGAARRVIGNMTQSLTVILKPGYAPVEQYADTPGLMQGAWTDAYALGATVHWAITGRPPPVAVGRIVSDTYVPLIDVANGEYSASFLQAIDRALKVLPAQRTPSIDAFRQDLGIGSPPTSASTVMRRTDPEATVMHIAATADPPPDAIRPSDGVAAEPVPLAVDPADASTRLVPGHRETIPPVTGKVRTSPPAPASPSPPIRRSRTRLILGSLIAAGVVGIAGIAVTISLQQRDGPQKTSDSPATRTPADAASSRREPIATDPATALPSSTPKAAPQASSAPIAPSPDPMSTPMPLAPSAVSRPASANREPSAPPARASRKPTSDDGATTARAGRRKTESDGNKECARLMTQLSLGDDDPSISARLRALNCQ